MLDLFSLWLIVLLVQGEGGDSLYISRLDESPRLFLAAHEGYQYQETIGDWLLFERGGDVWGLHLADLEAGLQVPPFPPLSLDPLEAALDFKPLFPPQAIRAPGLMWADEQLYALTGAEQPYSDLYALEGGELRRLTEVLALFPDVPGPILSASAEFIALRPVYGGFLYRARLRDGGGVDHNALYWYDPAAGRSERMPYFGGAPAWSPDGQSLIGARLGEERYELWRVDSDTGKEQFIAYGCHPQWSPDGDWVAYDLHQDPTWQNYTDCFSTGAVEAYEFWTGERVMFTPPPGVSAWQVLAWIPFPES